MRLLALILLSVSIAFVCLEHYTHFSFFGHMGAIPLEILLGAFLVEKYSARKEKEGKVAQLIHIKGYLFRSQMRNLFIANFNALKEQSITMTKIKESSVEQLQKMKEDLGVVKYSSPEEIELIIDEYVKARDVFHGFMDWAIENEVENIFQDMIYILHFIQDVVLFKEHNPGKLFITEAEKKPELNKKVNKILKDGIEKFIDYAIELKNGHVHVFDELMNDYILSGKIYGKNNGV